MKTKILLLAPILALLCSCNPVPKKSIFEPLDTKTLASLLDRDTLFGTLYEQIQDDVRDFNEIEKARFSDITYRNIYSMTQFIRDTVKLNPLQTKWIAEWEEHSENTRSRSIPFSTIGPDIRSRTHSIGSFGSNTSELTRSITHTVTM